MTFQVQCRSCRFVNEFEVDEIGDDMRCQSCFGRMKVKKPRVVMPKPEPRQPVLSQSPKPPRRRGGSGLIATYGAAKVISTIVTIVSIASLFVGGTIHFTFNNTSGGGGGTRVEHHYNNYNNNGGGGYSPGGPQFGPQSPQVDEINRINAENRRRQQESIDRALNPNSGRRNDRPGNGGSNSPYGPSAPRSPYGR